MKWKKDNKLPNTKNVKKKQPPQANNNNNNNTTNANNNSTTNAPRPQQPPVVPPPQQQPPMVPLPGRGLHTPHLPLTIEPKDEYGLTEL